MVCTFFGHRDCAALDRAKLREAIEQLVGEGVDTFYVGNQGRFDSIVFDELQKVAATHPRVSYFVVLAYLPTEKSKCASYEAHSIFPDGLETCPPRFAIDRRNAWMIKRADVCIGYVEHTWGGAYKFFSLAQKRGLRVINLGKADTPC